jgi:uncharacterized protein (DUF1499 family)
MASIKSAKTWSIIVFAVALLLLAATAYAIVGSRNGLTDYRSAFTLLRQIAQVGAGVLILSVVVLLFALKKRQGTVYAASATAVLAVLVGLMVMNQAAPPPGPLMNDITTDLEDPPQFDAVIPLRPQGSNPVAYGGAETAASQRTVHPEVQPLRSSLPPAQAFEQALRVAQDMGWDVVAQNASTGIVEAVDTTPFFRFKDDIVIRVRPDGQGSRVDLRSHSRVGISDLGKNAARIMAFSAEFSERTSSQ